MSKYDRMTKAELLKVIKQLEKEAGTGRPASREERERLAYELEVHETELKAQNEELRLMRDLLEESRDRYADLYDFAPAGYVTLNGSGIIQDINLTGAALFRTERARILGMPLTRYVAHDDIPRAREYLRQCWEKPEGASLEVVMNVPNRSGFEAQLISMMRKEAGEPVIRMTLLDITERKRAEKRARELTQALERRSQELDGANRELDLAQREMAALVYSVSHDLHVPIVQMEQLANALAEDYAGELPAEGHQVIELIRANARAANRLAGALLILSRVDKQSPHKHGVAMHALVKQVVGELQEQDPGRQVEIVLGDLPDAEGDPGLLKQLWVNLLSNAWKFTRKQDAARIEVGASEKDGVTMYYCRDNGAGFDMGESGRLFRAFQRLHHAEDFPGEGLGLAIVERIVHRHGGRIWANAQVDKGAAFYFTLG